MKYLVCISALFFSAQVFAQSFEPGLWTFKESLSLEGIPLPSSSNDDCITESQAKDAKGTIEKELKKQSCVLTKWVIKNKKLDATVSCNSDSIEAVGKLFGEFSRKSYDLTGEIKGKYKKALPAVAKLKLTGQWKSLCAKK